jgi:acetyl esterase/lipase
MAPPPTHADVKYGPHERNVLDLWRAPSGAPSPLVVFIHGGGFTAGDKKQARQQALVAECLQAGVSYAAINYRFRASAPIQDILRDAARAIQFLRFRAAEWNLDKTRIAAWGGSAGAGTSLWLAFHDDLAEPGNSDPVLRESTRLAAAGSLQGQASYDLEHWPQILGLKSVDHLRSGGGEVHKFYGLASEDEVRGERGTRIRSDVDMLGLISSGDAPVFLWSGLPDIPAKDRNHANHHPRHAIVVKQRCDEAGVPAVLLTGAVRAAGDEMLLLQRFLFRHLGVH